MKTIKLICWILAVIGPFVGGSMFLTESFGSTTTMEIAPIAAVSILFAVLPYCLAKAISEIDKISNG
jgi:hypothetical protein